MVISSLALTNFRNHPHQEAAFDPQLTLLVGPNGAGKTNVLEAVYALATGGSWRTEDAGEMVSFGAEVGHIEGNALWVVSSETGVSRGGEGESQETNLRVTLTRGVVGGKRVAKAKYLVDGVSKRKSDFVGQLRAVLFEPESLEIVIGEPGRRREFLNEVLSQTDREYAQSLIVYQRALRSRNRLLDAIREGKSRIEVLEYWERALVKHGALIQDRRAKLIDWISGQLATKDAAFWVEYEANAVSEGRFQRYRQPEIAAGYTFVGPQRDELLIVSDVSSLRGPAASNMHDSGTVVLPAARESGNPKDADTPSLRFFPVRTSAGGLPDNPDGKKSPPKPGSLVTAKSPLRSEIKEAGSFVAHGPQLLSSFGSRGEQRMTVLQLKLLEAKWIEQETGESPVMLLDDIFSELDAQHEKMVGKLVNGRQAIMTATEIHKGHYPEAKVINIA